MNKRLRSLIILLILLTMAGGAYWYFGRNPQSMTRLLSRLGLINLPAEGVIASGYIEADQVVISPEVSGPIAKLMVKEGDPVIAGQILAKIDTALLDVERAELEAGVAEAEARLALVQVGPRSEDIAVVEAAVTLAEVQQQTAYRAWQDALRLRDNPQELDLQIDAARAQLATTQRRLEQMVPLKDAAELMYSLRERQVKIIEEGREITFKIPQSGQKISVPSNVTPLEDLKGAEPGDEITAHYEFPEGTKRAAWAAWNLATTDMWTAWTGVNGAVAAYEAGQQNLDDLLALRNNPQDLQVHVAQAETGYQQASAGVEVARANLELIRAGATDQQLALARANLVQARAALETLDVQREKYTLRAPTTGMVLEMAYHEGEIIQPGLALMTLANLDEVELKVFIPEPQMGQVTLGQRAILTVDSYPAQTFAGQVVWIAAEAEYTPKNVQTEQERASTVFAVKVRLANPQQKLKPGMPADVKFDRLPDGPGSTELFDR